MKLPWLKKLSFLQGILLSLVATVIRTAALTASLSASSFPVAAQIKPDATLSHNSLVTPKLGNVLQVDGGTRAGNNLFHSFTQFNVPTGSTAFFNNALDVSNIFSRVTGNSASAINGILKANGTASLFLLNPNGIVFGKNAQLNIGGSFMGTTATKIDFADGTQFSAASTQTNSLLTVSVPIGLGFGNNPGAIRVEGEGHSLSLSNPFAAPIIGAGNSTGLRVLPEKTLALVGGDISLEGGVLTAPGGRIELGSVGAGVVSLSSIPSGWSLRYVDVPYYKDIQLSQRALADATGNGSGSIQLQGRNISLQDGSVILILNQGSELANTISVNASESVELDSSSKGKDINSFILNETLGSGNGGDITVFTKKILLENGSSINTKTFSDANGGNITIKAIDSMDVFGISPINSLTSNINATTFSSGQAGNVAISTGQLSLERGGEILSLTLGTGPGGNIIVNASQFVEVTGYPNGETVPSSLSAASFNAGNAGKLIINTSRLVLRDGGRVDSATLASGNAGIVTINASDSVEVTGTFPSSITPSLIDSSASITDKFTQQLFRLPPVPSGASGDVTINTRQFIVTNSGLVDVKNYGIGNAGNLIVNASSILLDNSGGITAATASGSGGNITLNAQQLQLRHSSLITATAGNSGNGGNLNINANSIIALENSPIAANANLGRGGNIQINTQGLFNSTDSPISASSNAGIQNQGVVNVISLGFDVNNALTPITKNLVSTEQAIASSCIARSHKERGRFVVTGTGGLATTPYDPLRGRYNLVGLKPLPENSSAVPNQGNTETSTWKIGDPIVEATGIVRTKDGRILLSSTPPNTKPESANSLVCHFAKVRISG